MINFSLCHPEKQVSPEEFIPGIKTEKEAFDLTKLSPGAQAAYVKKELGKKIYNRRGKR